MQEQTAIEAGKKTDVPLCCQGCVRWQKFGRQCFYYWEKKKHCTVWTSNYNDLMVM
ncbi:hypothetical protein HYU10_00800 [Candidatus Woesearchaeota archaeon]|nr:hypothetical protein [Candidatus Woesearchaeota archaeon]MBI2130288.1 hypothetical protein [Candidatus Woesearchaeota archaeon]MBI2661130.1 hypothetical protein [Candidatus Woesearchaeota archaeon]